MQPRSVSADLETGMAGFGSSESMVLVGVEAVFRAFRVKAECPVAATAGVGGL